MSKLIGGLVAGVIAAVVAGPAFSGDAVPARLLAPGKGASFDVGSTHIVGYFGAKGGQCDLTVMVGEAMSEDSAIPAAGSRVHVLVAPGTSARIDTAAGKSLAFVCAKGATAMTVKPIERVAYAPKA
jgi:hypothetical protein